MAYRLPRSARAGERRRLIGWFAGLALGALAAAAPLQAQVVAAAEPPRLLISVDGGYQAGTERFADQVRFRLYAEESTFDAAYEVRPGPIFALRGGVRLWRGLGVAVGVARYAERGGVSVAARLPHPFFFDRPRQVDGSGAGLQREELAWYLDALWLFTVRDRLTLQLFGGPSYVELRQDLVEQIEFTESYPYDTATFTGVRRTRRKARGPGFSVGLDGGYFFTAQLGVGATLRVGRVGVDLVSPDGERIALHGGGVQASGGLRFRF